MGYRISELKYFFYLEYSELKYWLDGEIKGTLNTALKAGEIFSANLTGLKDGKHTVEVTATVTVKSLTVYYAGITAQVGWGTASWTSSGKLNFTTDANAPNVSIVSQQNRTFETADVPLNFTVNEPVTMLSYSLDENNNVTFSNVNKKCLIAVFLFLLVTAALPANFGSANFKVVNSLHGGPVPQVKVLFASFQPSSSDRHIAAGSAAFNFTVDAPSSWLAFSSSAYPFVRFGFIEITDEVLMTTWMDCTIITITSQD